MQSLRIVARLEVALCGLLLAANAAAQGTTRVSISSSGGEAQYDSWTPSISADGQVVAFASIAGNLVPDINLDSDIFVHDRSTGITEVISLDASGGEANNESFNPSISADGRFVAYWSHASDLVSLDLNAATDVFVRDRSTGITERVSVDSTGLEGNDWSFYGAISADGRYVAFVSYASNLVAGDTNGAADWFVHDRTTGITERVSVDSAGNEGQGDSSFISPPAISADGRVVAFQSEDPDLVAGDLNATSDIFVHDRSTGITERVDVDSSGAEADGFSYQPQLSSDGSIVAFTSIASNLVAGDANGAADVFVHDRSTGITERVSVGAAGAEGDDWSSSPSLSADGSTVAFVSMATTLIADDTTPFEDVYVRDRRTGVTELISVAASGQAGNNFSGDPAITPDGASVAFWSLSSNLVANDFNYSSDVFVRDRCLCDATWTNYGTGLPGTHGIPSFTARADPILGGPIDLDLANSSGSWTVGLLFLGFQRAAIPSTWGGVLVVDPAATIVVGLPPIGMTLHDDLPLDDAFCGLIVDLQAIESDPGAARGVSFSAGLELLLGH